MGNTLAGPRPHHDCLPSIINKSCPQLMRFLPLALASMLSLSACAPPAQTRNGADEPPAEAPLVDLKEDLDPASVDAGEPPVELLMVDTEDKPIPGAWVEVGGRNGNRIVHADSMGIVTVPQEAPILIYAGARGFAIGSIPLFDDSGLAKSGTIHLERCAWVELTIPDSLELPEGPLFLSVGLVTKRPGGSSTPLTAGVDRRGSVFDHDFQFGDERRVRIAASGGPQFEVDWCLVHDPGFGRSVDWFQDGTGTITVNGEGDPTASFEISPVASKLAEAIRAWSDE